MEEGGWLQSDNAPLKVAPKEVTEERKRQTKEKEVRVYKKYCLQPD